jgi:uncharacterized membrane protein YfcA
MFYYGGLVVLGFVVGVLSGLFGIGGGFFLVPMLNAVFNVPYNIAIGSSLCQMVGTTIAASVKHHDYGHIDYKLAVWLLAGSVVGAETGAQILMWLHGIGNVAVRGHSVSAMSFCVDIIFVTLLLTVGIVMFVESNQATQREPRGGVVETVISQRIRNIRLSPMINLPVSGIASISVWFTLTLGLGVGLLSGLLGIGGGFVVSPALIYLFGISTNVAIGTGLFQIIFTSAYGAASHFVKGNIDFLLVGCILAGSLGGSHFGAVLHKRMRGAHIRYYFSLLVLVAVAVILVKFVYSLGYFGK